jgi:hypothetical protein
MKQNVGTVDRIIRIVVGAAGIVFLPSWWKAVGVVVLATGLIGWCGLYTLLGKSTCRLKK